MMNDELRKDNNRFTGARVLVSRFAFSLSKKIELNKSLWRSRNLSSERFLVAEGFVDDELGG